MVVHFSAVSKSHLCSNCYNEKLGLLEIVEVFQDSSLEVILGDT